MNDEITNIYSKLPKKYLDGNTKNDNPNFKKHLIKIPFRAVLIGPSGSGKTQILVHLLNLMSDTFWHVYLICPNAEQPLYKYMRDALGDNMTIYNDVSELPQHKELEPKGKHKIVIFDDLISVNKNKMKLISDYYIGARHSRCSCIFLSQSFYDVPKIIRLQCNYVMIRKIGNNRDLVTIIKTYSISDINKETLKKMYHYCTDGDNPNFMMIDLENPSSMFRRNFLNILNPADFGYKEE